MTGIYDHARRAQNRRMALLAAASLTTLLPAAALAQAEDAAPAAEAAGDDGAIIVTARRRDESILETPIAVRSEEHTSELQSLMRISYAVFCLKKKTSIEKRSKVS